MELSHAGREPPSTSHMHTALTPHTGFCRYSCQHDASDWVPRLQQAGGRLFRLVDYSAFPHALRLPNFNALADLLDARGSLRAALGSSRRRSFHAALRRLVGTHFGPGAPIEVPLVTKVRGQPEEGGCTAVTAHPA